MSPARKKELERALADIANLKAQVHALESDPQANAERQGLQALLQAQRDHVQELTRVDNPPESC